MEREPSERSGCASAVVLGLGIVIAATWVAPCVRDIPNRLDRVWEGSEEAGDDTATTLPPTTSPTTTASPMRGPGVGDRCVGQTEPETLDPGESMPFDYTYVHDVVFKDILELGDTTVTIKWVVAECGDDHPSRLGGPVDVAVGGAVYQEAASLGPADNTLDGRLYVAYLPDAA